MSKENLDNLHDSSSRHAVLDNQDAEISLADIILFVSQSYQKLIGLAFLGLLIGLTGWFFLVKYQAEWVIHNNPNTSPGAQAEASSSYALDLVSWRTIQKSLPSLADQMVEQGKAPQGQLALYKAMSDPIWWSKNVMTNYAITKADTKDLATLSKNLDGASTTILSLSIKATGHTREEAIDHVRFAAQFLLQGGAYLQIKSLINGLESETIGTAADIQSKITSTQIELGYLEARAKNLEQLLKRFPGSSGTNQQVIDPKDSSAKYLPLSTQLIAVNTDINLTQENLVRLADRLAQITLIKSFLEQAKPLVEESVNGITITQSLLEEEAKLRASLGRDDAKSRQFLDSLRSSLLTIQSRFTKGLEANTAPIAQKTGMLKSAVAGLMAGLFLALIALIGVRVYRTALA